jgi:bifunctional oligoribonuclease and PAP phosphatase NrnA
MNNRSDVFRVAGEKVQSAQRIVLFTHIRPDGDAIGSLLGLGLALIEQGKTVQMVSADGIPPAQRNLEGSHLIIQEVKNPFDLVIVLDCSDRERVGKVFESIPVPDLNIDHHITNNNFAKINIVNPQAVATAEIVVDLLLSWGQKISKPVAEALLTGILTDTIGFRTSNTSAKALYMSANLMEAGADLAKLYYQSLVQRTYSALRFWGIGLENLAREGRMVWATMTQSERQAVGYPGKDDADLIQVLSTIEDADISLVFVEQPNGRVKVSWRAQPGFDVSKIAVKFGGGGHPAAAGADLSGNLNEVRTAVLSETRLLLEMNGNE